MPDYIGHKETVFEKVMFVGVILALGLLFVALSQPAWRGEEMVAELKAHCDQRGGIVLESKKMFGTSYECVEDWHNDK